VCKLPLNPSQNQLKDLRDVIHGLEMENATVEQVAEYARKVHLHWTGRDKISQKPRAPAILKVLEYWRQVLSIDENENQQGGQNAINSGNNQPKRGLGTVSEFKPGFTSRRTRAAAAKAAEN